MPGTGYFSNYIAYQFNMILKKIYPPKPVVSYLIPTKKSAHDHLDQKLFFEHESYTICSYVTKFGNFRRGFSKVGLSRTPRCAGTGNLKQTYLSPKA